MAIKTENKIWIDMIALLEMGASQMGIGGFSVMQHSQPSPTSSHAAILLSRISSHREGWQGVQYKNEDSALKADNGYCDIVTFQVSAYRPRTEDDDENTTTALDAVNALASWINTREAINEFAKKGIRPFLVTDVREPWSADDSNSPQMNPSFDIRVVVPQSFETTIPSIDVFPDRNSPANIDLTHRQSVGRLVSL